MSRATALLVLLAPVAWAGAGPRSPIHLVLSRDEARAFVVNRTAGTVSVLDPRARAVVGEVPVGGALAHAALAPDGKLLFVSDQHGGEIAAVDLEQGRVVRRVPAGAGPYGFALSADGRRLLVVESYANRISVRDARTGKLLRALTAGVEPRYLALCPDESRVLVSEGLARGASLLDLRAGRPLQARALGRASITRQAACSPDGRWGFIAHVVSHDDKLTVQMERGFIHANGFSALDLARAEQRATLLLDALLDGAANPWGLALAPDGGRLFVTLAGVGEAAIVDLGKALTIAGSAADPEALERDAGLLERTGFARRAPTGGEGPRGLAYASGADELLVANFFSDTVGVLDGHSGALKAVIPLGPPPAETSWRKGERLFNDAALTYQRWFTCASCHQEDASIDGLNWDLINDGIGNPKSAKSLHDAHDTPPAMWTGVREDMNAAVAAGQRFAGFLPEPGKHAALMAYLSAPPRPPNPHRVREPETVRRGERVFRRARCAACHPPPAYADGKAHDLGLRGPRDLHSRYDTPSLRDVWRGAPYLHDGSAPTLESVFRARDPRGLHGLTRGLSAREFAELMAFVRSL